MDKNTGDYQLVREKNNTYVNQDDMGPLIWTNKIVYLV
jgi:hypothetical protein